MINEELKCPHCGVPASKGQKFCGDCGQKLKNVCLGCDTANPPLYKFCGQCGKDLVPVGVMLLDRAGLIIEADDIASAILQSTGDNILGKPFSIFVNISDRAFFFSHWNMLVRSTKPQSLEVELNTGQQGGVFTHLVLKPMNESGGVVDQIRIEIDDVTDLRNNLQQLEEKESLLEFIGSMTEIFHPANREIRKKTISGVLEKIAMLSGVPYVFIARFDQAREQVVNEFTWRTKDNPKNGDETICLPVDTIRPFLEKLKNGNTYVVDDCNSLKSAERQVWQKWHQRSSSGAILCELMYREKQPVGIMGVARTESGMWPRNIIILIKLAAKLIADTLPWSLSAKSVLQQTSVPELVDALEEKQQKNDESNDFGEVEVIIDEHEVVEDSEGVLEKMQLEPVEYSDSEGALPIFATDDGVYILKCPKCELSETVSVVKFEESGWILRVICPCGCSFRIIREMRKTHRKDVKLEGLFTSREDEFDTLAVSSGWGPMEVTNISKTGLNFETPQARLLQVGEDIQLRFNLDNNNKSLIKKSAKIKSVRKNSVGCQFQNSDKSDVTLGFYFL